MDHEYRSLVRAGGLVSFRVRVVQTDMFIRAETDLTDQAHALIIAGRAAIEAFAAEHPDFLTSLEPLPPSPLAVSPVREMLAAGRSAGVGPMAAVAGALAEFVGRGLASDSPSGVLVENGGDLFLLTTGQVVVGLYAGRSVLSMRLGLVIDPRRTPMGLCASSGSLGHSLSLGRADAAVVAADSAALADAAATALGNRVARPRDLEKGLEWVLALPGVRGAVAVLGDKIGAMGEIELTPL
ncbi:MAG: UPF0280 family protein [Pseudomonadota bacterium]